MKKKILFLTALMLVALLAVGAGCVKVRIKGVGVGGVFKSTDRAENWSHKVGILTVGKEEKSIGGVDVNVLVFDPTDSRTIYLGSKRYGLFYTHTGAEGWEEAKGLPRGEVRAISVDRLDPARAFVAIGNEIYKSRDCCRRWEKVYFETKAGLNITSLAVDPADSAKVYAGVSDGRFLRSIDGGQSWSSFHDFKKEIYMILISPIKSNLIYVAVSGQLFKSTDSGASWQDLTGALKEYNGMAGFMDIQFIVPDESLSMITKYGILRSDDGGASWRAYKLISRPGQVTIYSLAFNPQNPNEIYYGTEAALYKATDGGANWQSKNLPTNRVPVKLLVDPETPNVLYMGVAEIKK